jgi:hypothetical protein
MMNAKIWVCAIVVFAALAGMSLSITTAPTMGAAENQAVVKSHWRHHDGHWNYWDDADKRWYYTDGANWYFSDGNAWKTYNFDAQFGREGFEKGEYKVPGEGVRVVVPTHRVYVPQR